MNVTIENGDGSSGTVSTDSNYEPTTPTVTLNGSADDLAMTTSFDMTKYDAAAIRAEFLTYKSILPPSCELLQAKPSFQLLRSKIEDDSSNSELPLFLRYKFEGGIKPHHALCCLLLSEYEETQSKIHENTSSSWYALLIQIVSLGACHPQIHNPALFIRDQFYRVAPAIPTEVVDPNLLRKVIRNRGLPIPNYFLDPEDPRQFPPHIALLVILQDEHSEKGYTLGNVLYEAAFSLFALIALILRIVLEVIGGAGAIWGGAEVLTLRTAENAELWRWISVSIGILCYLRFLTLNAPQMEDEGDMLGPAGPWSLRLPVRLRAVCDHPFHYFARALSPSLPQHPKKE